MKQRNAAMYQHDQRNIDVEMAKERQKITYFIQWLIEILDYCTRYTRVFDGLCMSVSFKNWPSKTPKKIAGNKWSHFLGEARIVEPHPYNQYKSNAPSFGANAHLDVPGS